MRIVGGLLVVLAAMVAVVAVASWRFERQVAAESRSLLGSAHGLPDRVVEAREISRLPAPVRRWLERSGSVGRPRAVTVRLKQRGEMRPALDKPWMPVAAEQYFSVDPPGFVWGVKAKMKGVPIAGRDRWAGGRGHMLIKLASLIPVADAVGPEIDQGAMLRFLGEIIWFPSAALSPEITWEAIDERRARASMEVGGVKASAVFAFDEQGRFSALSAERYMSAPGGPRLETWVIPITEWRVVRGIEMPVRGNATWKLAGGEFDYYRWEILDVEVNEPGLYGDAPARPLEVSAR